MNGVDFGNVSEKDQVKINTMIEQLQVRDSLQLYNSLVKRCFAECVDSFTSKKLKKQEADCVERCAEKFMRHTRRAGERFAELNQGGETPEQSS